MLHSILLPSGVFFFVPSLDLSLASCSVHGWDFLSRRHQSMVAAISGSSRWALAQSVMCICVLSLVDLHSPRWSQLCNGQQSQPYILAPLSCWLLKSNYQRQLSLLWRTMCGAAFSGHQSSSFSLKTSKIVSSPGIRGTASSTFLASLSEACFFKASATVLFLPFWYSREKSYFASSFIHLCFMASLLGEVRKYMSKLLSVQTLKQ